MALVSLEQFDFLPEQKQKRHIPMDYVFVFGCIGIWATATMLTAFAVPIFLVSVLNFKLSVAQIALTVLITLIAVMLRGMHLIFGLVEWYDQNPETRSKIIWAFIVASILGFVAHAASVADQYNIPLTIHFAVWIGLTIGLFALALLLIFDKD